MNSEQENFGQLRRLLKLKRYEQPPPRYFNDFATQVVARIRAGETGSGAAAVESGSWLQKLWSLIEAKPMLPATVGVAMCALLVVGALSTDHASGPAPSIITDLQPASSALAPIIAANQDPAEAPALPFTSTKPIIPGGSLFDQIRLSSQPVMGTNSLIPFDSN
jgi:hypothetical protein